MTDISKVQTASASEVYDQYKVFGSVLAARILTNCCEAKSEEMDQLIDEQNEYLSEIEVQLSDITALQEDMNSRVAELEAEISKLLEKKDAGTITEEEEEELASKSAEVKSLTSDTNSQVTSKNSEVKTLMGKSGDCTATINSAEDYGKTAIEKGTPLAETKNKRKSFWRKMFGGWDKSKTREAGEELVKVGEELNSKVANAKQVVGAIKTKSK